MKHFIERNKTHDPTFLRQVIKPLTPHELFAFVYHGSNIFKEHEDDRLFFLMLVQNYIEDYILQPFRRVFDYADHHIRKLGPKIDIMTSSEKKELQELSPLTLSRKL